MLKYIHNWEPSYTINGKWGRKSNPEFRRRGQVLSRWGTYLPGTFPLKLRLLKCYVFPVLLYGAEAWTMIEQLIKKLSAFEMWLYRRILRISCTDHITNEEVLWRVGKQQEIAFTVKRRKLEYFCYLMRHNKYPLHQLILQGKVDGRRGPGRWRNSWLQNLRQWFGLTSVELFRQAANKIKIVMLIANVRNG